MKSVRTIGVCLSLLTSAGLAAQGASSPGFFLTGAEFGAGGSALSSRYDLAGSFGSGVVAGRGSSTRFTLVGGFVASLDTAASGRPWATGVRPLHAARNGSAALTVHGTELDLGASTSVKVGGRVASVTGRTRDAVGVVLPRDVAPGWQDVEVTAAGATSVLPRAIGVLPMMDLPRPAVPGLPFSIRFRGTRGDSVLWAVAARRLPFTLPIPPFGYGLELDPALMLVLNVTAVTDPQGVFDLPIPGVQWIGPLYVQGLAMSSHGGYGPGTFTNVIQL